MDITTIINAIHQAVGWLNLIQWINMVLRGFLFVLGLVFTKVSYSVEVNDACYINIDSQYKKVNAGDSDFSAFTYSTSEMKLKYISISINVESFEFSKKRAFKIL
ncbi:hypothetical protein, partial [Pseudoalteromonas luteoviolacea]|uniref:hypothetical protein n=1 Tax=Pseudoalteromonas luteoviolacea TaxID=43657 RepID=UPI001E59EA26